MAEGTVIFEIIASAKGVKVVQKQTDDLAKSSEKASKSTDKLSKSRDAYHRKEKGAAQISSNQTKNFSKMQQGIDGGGGSGGLVRAYALLAANVFALTAAFGVLSRSAQVDTLVQSMEVLSTTGGTYIKSLAKEMQEASGFAIDLAQSFRQVSLAASAGLNTSEIEGLTTVAKGAAISLGRNLPDAMDRIFRGAIKLEPEILDEIGLFIRVDEAAQKYARNNGKVTSSLTQVEKRQAFLNEILEQGTRKFQQYAEEIKPDPYVRLGAALGDIAQSGLSLLNSVLAPLLNFLADSKGALTAVFGVLVFSLVKKAIPALGQFNQNIAENAQQAAQNARDYTAGLKATTTAEVEETNKKLAKKRELLEADRKITGKGKGRASQAAAAKAVDKALKTELNGEKRLELLRKKEKLMEKQILASKEKQQKLLKQDLADMRIELSNLEQQERLTKQIADNEARGRIDPKKGSLSQRRQEKLDQRATSTTILAGAANKAEQQGMREGFRELNKELKDNKKNMNLGSRAMTRFTGVASILGTGISRLMMILGPWMMLLSILSPIIFKIGKMLGFGSEESKKFTESSKKLADQFKNLDKRFRAQVVGMEDMNLTYRENLRASTAFFKNLQETSQGMLDLKEDFDSWQKTANGFQKWWEGTKNWFGFGKEVAMNELFLQGTKEALIALVEAGKTDFIKTFNDMGVATDNFSVAVLENKKATRDLNEALEGGHEALGLTEYKYGLAISSGIAAGKQATSLEGIQYSLTTQFYDLDEAQMKVATSQAIATRTAINLEEESGKLGLTTETGAKAAEINAEKAKIMAQAMGNLESALKGAEESVGKFNQAMMPKTKVDDILGSFESIRAKIDELAKISETEVVGFFEGFADPDNALAPLFKDMFVDVVEKAEDGTEKVVRKLKDGFGKKQIKDALKDVQKEFEKYRQTIIKSKTELKILANQEKRYAQISAAGRGANAEQQNLITQQRTKELEVSKKLTDITLRNLGYDRESFGNKLKTFKALTDQKEINEWLTANKLTMIDMLALENQFLDEGQKKREETIAILTEEDRIKKQFNEELLKQAELEFSLLKGKRENLKLEQELAAAKMGTDVRGIDSAAQTLAVAKEQFEFEKNAAEIKKKILDAEKGILLTKTKLLLMEAGLIKTNEDTGEVVVEKQAQTWLDSLAKGFDAKSGALDAALKGAALKFGIATAEAAKNSFKAGSGTGILGAIRGASAGVAATGADGKINTGQKDAEGNDIIIEGLTKQEAAVQVLKSSYQELAETMGQFGPAGQIVAGVASGSLSILSAMENQVAGNKAIDDAVKDTTNSFGENNVAMAKGAQTAEMVGGVLSGVGQMLAANSSGQIAEIDQQIAAEKRRDGKSKESLAKIAQMEKKKEAMQKKAFDQNKKVQMAVTIANTAASIMAALAAPPIGLGPIAGMPLAVMAGAMGALQLAVIAKTKYQGGGGQVQQPSATKLSIGKRDNSVDVSRGSSSGELSYLRGERGVGSNANNFTASGAMGRKSYASGGEGILVGERGPEVITPSQKIDVIPNDKLGGNTNVNFSINAVDAAGVEDLLVNQRGNIIRMIREAANDTGERFLETVDTQAYGSST